MTGTKLRAALLTTLVCGLVVAGCGGDDDTGSGSDEPGQVVTAPGVDKEALEAGQEAADRASKGDKEGALEKVREACVKQAEASLSGAAEEQAVENCEKAGGN